ncbi:MAG: zinc ribbon domain-containing protein [Anaerolineae bacterium]|nr:zinc ribbon domain-containing protein [Anaerolineae bacterium]
MECNSRFEIMRTMKEADAPLLCNSCSSTYVKRLPSLVNSKSGSGKTSERSSSRSGCGNCSSQSCAGCRH